MAIDGIQRTQQDILMGSAKLTRSSDAHRDRLSYSVENMAFNKSYLLDEEPDSSEKLGLYRNKFIEYRKRWSSQSTECVNKNLSGPGLIKNGYIPLCLDIETASICDLACEFCYREALATPDKVITEKLFRRIVDQAAELGVPSMKFNWRGEPLLNPKLPRLIEYAKSKGVIDTIINTNATQLTESKSRDLINAGLDFMIYSFDGGTKETYERMRPGRFRKNSFEEVYRNIQRFAEVRAQMNARFPWTKIQMILTEDTYEEQESFFELFADYVDEVTVTQYSERGGHIEDLNADQKSQYESLCAELDLPIGSPYLRDSDGNISVSKKRLPCEQPYQRVMMTYDGRAAMCCYDWGAMHPIGYTDDTSFADEDADKWPVLKKAEAKHKGFELLNAIELPPKFNSPEKTVATVAEIWEGQEVAKVRLAHIRGEVDQVEICKKCPFKDTYEWSDPK